ncbi:MAG: alkaline phosphatase D family protein [Emcibacteraceae bacterium]|nr:alkaline phosphatase D family protein [Emcibacteraceae bacterium]MDG1725926.1 alkaline phosphatase D family protein [Emcibacteraceae bacterium]
MKGRWNLPFYADKWYEYSAAREKFYDLCKFVGVSDAMVLMGDSQSFWVNKLYDGNGHSMGVKIGTAAISSQGDFMNSGCDEEKSRKLHNIFAE